MNSFFAKSIFLVFISFAIILFSNIQILNIPIFSQDDDKRGFGIQERERAGIHAGNDSRTDDDKRGFGIQERERAGIHAGNDSRILNNDYSSLILIITVVIIIAVSSYALYKIYVIRRKSNQSKLKK